MTLRILAVFGIFSLASLLGTAAGISDNAGAESPEALLNRLRRDEAGPNPPLPEDLSNRLNGIAEKYLDSGDLPRSIELLTGAVTADVNNGVALANLSLAYLRHGDVEFAEFYLDLARQQASKENLSPQYFEALGNAFEALNRMDDALAAWEESLSRGNRSSRLRRRILLARTDWAYSHGQKFLSGDRFQIFYDPAISAKTVELINQYLETAAESESNFFMVPAPADPIIILYEGRRYFDLLDTPDWVAGFYDGKIRIPIERSELSEGALLGLLRHELAHAFLQSISRGRSPSWLQEGLAQYVEGKRIEPHVVRNLSMSKNFLEESDLAFRQRNDREQARIAYLLALSYVQHLIRIGGPGAAVCLATDLGNGSSLSDSFQREFGALPSAMELGWRASLDSERSP